MAWSLSSPVTGSAQTGLTSPTYTVTADAFPTPNGKQYAVTALGGTQISVQTTSVANPFTIAFTKPAVAKQRTLDAAGKLVSAPMNVYKQITRKGVAVVADGTLRNMLITTTIEVPAGGEYVDPVNVRAAMSAHLGALTQTSAGIGDTLVNGIF